MRRHVETSLGARVGRPAGRAGTAAGPVTAPVPTPAFGGAGRRLLLRPARALGAHPGRHLRAPARRAPTGHRARRPGGLAGRAHASFAVVPLLLAVPSGQATDRFGERRVMLAGAVLMLRQAVIFLDGRGGAAGLVAGQRRPRHRAPAVGGRSAGGRGQHRRTGHLRHRVRLLHLRRVARAGDRARAHRRGRRRPAPSRTPG